MPMEIGAAAIPTGLIAMWSGTLANIPGGWALCNGAGVTPDLRSRFVRGTAAGVDPGGVGGNDAITLIIANLPSHTHGTGTLAIGNESAHTHGTGTLAIGNESAHTHAVGTLVTGNESAHTHAKGTLVTNNIGAHSHTLSGTAVSTGAHVHSAIEKLSSYGSGQRIPGEGGGSNEVFEEWFPNDTNSAGAHAHTLSGTAVSTGNHTHTILGSTAAGTAHNHTITGDTGMGTAHNHTITGATGATGGAVAFDNRPAYYALAFIIKI